MRQLLNRLVQNLRVRPTPEQTPGPFEFGRVGLKSGVEFLVLRDGAPVSRSEWLAALTEDADARRQFDVVLREAALREPAFLLELPAHAGIEDPRAARFALLPAPALARIPIDRHSFSEFFREANEMSIRTFENLGGDARLVAPSTRSEFDWRHLAAFERGSPQAVRERLWEAAFDEFATELRLGGPKWLSTSGFGVGWLHVRVDSRPKYLTHEPYRDGWTVSGLRSTVEAQ